MSPQTIDRRALDEAKVEAFTERMVGYLNGGAMALMMSIGHRARLFDRLASLPPSTSDEVAEETGLQERYVREWLGAVVTGGLVDYDATTQRYSLPPEHAACLTRAAGADNISNTAQFIAVLGGVETEILDCFERGGGVPYTSFERFHDVMAEESQGTVVAALEDVILPLVPGIQARLEKGIRVLDIGCGSGRAMLHLARRYPASQFCGFDFSKEAIERARAQAKLEGTSNVRFEVRDVTAPLDAECFDLVTAFDAIHDQAHPDRVLANIRRALAKDGTFLMQDIRASSHLHHNLENPIAPFLYTISCMHCMTVSLASEGGAGLGTCWGEELAVSMLEDAGFRETVVHKPEHDLMNNFYVSKP